MKNICWRTMASSSAVRVAEVFKKTFLKMAYYIRSQKKKKKKNEESYLTFKEQTLVTFQLLLQSRPFFGRANAK